MSWSRATGGSAGVVSLRKLLRWVAWMAAVLVVTVASLGAVVYWRSERALHLLWQISETTTLPPVTEIAQLERGRHLAVTRGCTDCHGADLGGRVVLESELVGRMAAPNLTSGGPLALDSDGSIDRAIRHGVRRDGRALLFMPSSEYYNLSDGDAAALIAWLQVVPAVQREVPASRLGPLGRALWFADRLPVFHADRIPHEAVGQGAPPEAVSVDYGRYVAQACTGCHGNGMAGGAVPGVPPNFPKAANLTAHDSGLKAWTEDDFVRALREGKRPDGSGIDEFMPWRAVGQMKDVELRAMWSYLRSLPPREFGLR